VAARMGGRTGKTDLAREAPLCKDPHLEQSVLNARQIMCTLPDLTFKNFVLCSHSKFMDFCNKDTEWQRHMCAVNVSYDSLPPEVRRTESSRHGHNVYLRPAQFCFARDFYEKFPNNKMS
jgi:hypothetical protein